MTPEQLADIKEFVNAYGDARIMCSRGRVSSADVTTALDELLAAIHAIAAPPAPAPVQAALSDAEILHLWDTHVCYETGVDATLTNAPLTDADKIAFARALLAAAPSPDPQPMPDAHLDKGKQGLLAVSEAETRLLEVLHAVQAYLPPDGVSAHDTLTRIIGLVDPWPLEQKP